MNASSITIKANPSHVAFRTPCNQPFQINPEEKSGWGGPKKGKARHSKPHGRWAGGGTWRRYDDRKSAYPNDYDGKAEILIVRLYHGPTSTRLEKKKGHWYDKGLQCAYHQGALVGGFGLNEAERLQRKKDLRAIKDELDSLR